MNDTKPSLEADLFELIRGLWTVNPSHPFYDLMPRSPEFLRIIQSRIKEFIAYDAQSLEGFIDLGAIIRGNIVSMGKCSELITSGARLDYIADFDLDYLRIKTSLG